ncbi:MAG: HutD family protein [Synergistaceae bacterium]|jgi:hypothetical protein|nr:HutD family protein [Synergistaceae bacterium]
MIEFVLKHREDCGESRWAGGSTREFFIYPETSACASRDFEIRVSSASVLEDSSVFSDFTGFVRHIAVLSGTLCMIHGGVREVSLGVCEADTFDGGEETVSRGRCTDFNLIHVPSREGSIRPLAGVPGEARIFGGYAGCCLHTGSAEAAVSEGDGSPAKTPLRVSLSAGDFFILKNQSPGVPVSLKISPSDHAVAVLFSVSGVKGA